MRGIHLIWPCLLLGCQHHPVAQQRQQPLLILREEQVDAAVGKLVTIQGEVAPTKIPTILGVDVESFDPDLRGQPAQATGILEKWTVTQEQLERERAQYGPLPGRGAGTFYRLVKPGTYEVVPLSR